MIKQIILFLQNYKFPFLILAVIVIFSLTDTYEILEYTLLDQRYKIRGALPCHEKAGVIEINNETLQSEGNFRNWTRNKHSYLVNILHQFQAKSLCFDIFFAEPHTRNVNYQLFKEQKEELQDSLFSVEELDLYAPAYDSVLAKEIEKAGNVFLSHVFETERKTDFEKYDFYREDKIKSLKAQEKSSIPVKPYFDHLKKAKDINTPLLSKYAESAKGVGFAQIITDRDGIVRHYPLLYQYEGRVYPSLSLIAALDFMELSMDSLSMPSPHQIKINTGGSPITIPLCREGLVLINWIGKFYQTLPVIPYVAIKNLSKQFILKEIKKFSASRPDLTFEPEKLKNKLPLEEMITRLGGGDREIIPVINEVVENISLFSLFQMIIENNPSFSYRDIAEEMGFPPDDKAAFSVYENIRYHHLIFHNKNSLHLADSLKKAIAKNLEDIDTSLFQDCLRDFHEYDITEKDKPFFFYPPTVVEKIGPLYPSYFKDKVFFYGATASGTHDLNPMPFSPRYPMVGVHANLFNSIVNNNFLVESSYWTNLAIWLLITLLLPLLLKRFKTVTGSIVTFFVLVLTILLIILTFTKFNTWLDLLSPSLLIISIFIYQSIQNYLIEEKEKKQIKGAFSHYVTPSLVEQILDNPDRLKLGGEKRTATVFFSDIQSFTSISENIVPEKLVEILNHYLTEVTDIILDNRGMLDKYEGDAVMAVFGVPIDFPEHAEAACASAIRIQKRLNELARIWKEKGWPALYTRIGLNTGEMIAGNMGSKSRFDYTVMGDSVNLGSRLEGANKQYGTRTMLSETTYHYVKDKFITREIDVIKVKGKNKPVRVYELIDFISEKTPEKEKFLDRYHECLTCFHERNWHKAHEGFHTLSQDYPEDQLSDIYHQRSEHYLENPPPDDWDGVFVMTRK